ncbi:dipeptidase [Tenacibaculum sp. M341]|uniref:dipeptidase n=1 Tax=Tenacibaculum sp. M341 TaxID=2530339 RepID=UPI001048E162|nr:membrane dipeptidase [Tenacibaculum sp. M341]TCI85712.1 peptidase M19 [Tenacibaculum sp. M341]
MKYKTKKRFAIFSMVLVVLYFLVTLIAPPLLDKGQNKTIEETTKVSNEAKILYNNLDFVGDLHCDALLWDRDLSKENDYGHVDFQRMSNSNVAFQAFTIVTKSPKGHNFEKTDGEAFDNITLLSILQGQSVTNWFSLFNRAMYQCNKLKGYARAYNDNFILIEKKDDLLTLLKKRATNKKIIGGIIGLEGGHCLEGEIENFLKLYDNGVRMLGLSHFFDNKLGGSAHGIEKGGITEFGKKVLGEMQKRNMILDIAHTSDKMISDIIKTYNGPIVSSHTGVDGVIESYRNLSDEQLKLLAKKDALIGVAFFPGAIGNDGIRGIVKTMKHVKELIGVEHVALGSDFDGSVTTPIDVTGYQYIVEEMLQQNFSKREIEMIMGENLKNFLLKNLPN